MENPLTWRNCPKCGVSLVDAEISETLKFTCEPGAFHSSLLGIRDKQTWEIKHWKCPECEKMFSVEDTGETGTIQLELF